MALREFAGGAKRTTITGDITSGSTTITVTDATGYPTGATGPFAIALRMGQAAEEKVLIASRSGNTLTVGIRGYDGTTASDHSSGATVDHVLTAIDVRESNTHVNATTADPHGDRAYADTAVTTHEGAADPHPGYLTEVAATAALALKQSLSEKGQANGYAALGSDGIVPSAQLPAVSGGDLLLIGTVTLGAAAAAITFSSIPSTYRDLQVRGQLRSALAASSDDVFMRCNGDAGTNYDWLHFTGNGSGSPTMAFANPEAQARVGLVTASSALADSFGSLDLTLFGYAGARHKGFHSTSFARWSASNVNHQFRQSGGAWGSTAAVTSLVFTPGSAANWQAGSTLSLYGVKG